MKNEQKPLTTAELEAGLTKLEKSVLDGAGAQVTRRNELLQKAQAGSLTAEENTELVKSLSSPQTFAKSVTAPLQTDDMVKSVDVSDFLKEQHAGLISSLEVLASHMEKSEVNEQTFRSALATTLHGTVDLLKSMDARLGTLEGQPAHAPRALGNGKTGQPATPLQKSVGGPPAGGGAPMPEGLGDLTKSQFEDVVGDMLQKGVSHLGGVPILVAAAELEHSGTLSKSALGEVADFMKAQKNGKAA